MKKDNPRYSHYSGKEVYCGDCPFTDKFNEVVGNLCREYGDACPTAATYQAACEFAEAHKEG